MVRDGYDYNAAILNCGKQRFQMSFQAPLNLCWQTYEVHLKTNYGSRKKVVEKLPNRFENMFDGWSDGKTHYVAVYASLLSIHQESHDSVLLALARMGDEDSLQANDLYKYRKFVLSVCNKIISSVVALIEDTENTERAFSRSVDPFFVGCHGHFTI